MAIPVTGHTVVEDHDVRFHQVHRADGGRVRNKRVCEVDGAEVAPEDIVKGFDVGGGERVLLEDSDFEHLPLTTAHMIDVHQFVPADQIDPIMYDKPYYLEPDGPAALRAYALMRDALRGNRLVGIAKVAIRAKEQLAAIRVYADVIVLSTLLWPDEVRDPDDLKVKPTAADKPHANELQMTLQLIDSRTEDWNPQDPRFHDDYTTAVREVIAAKVEGREIIEAPAPASENTGAAMDLLEALRASVAQARQIRPEPEPAKKKTARALKAVAAHPDEPEPKKATKTVAKKTPAKKVTKPRKTA
ncbi:Ku protein [Longispora sp. K20-0274]|uniref:non-homologous end joining protein Ku n=1 Tax=Longispora sp. K20-0274 TaxID=3088255 RepID=UPI00399AA143